MTRDQRGVATIEFLVAFFPVFTLFLATVQLSFLRAGHLVVQHAAYRAARSAVVVLEDVPASFDGASRGDITAGSDEASNEFVQALWSFLELDASGLPQQNIERAGGARMQAIRQSAYLPLMSIAPKAAWFEANLGGSATSLYDSLGGGTFGSGGFDTALRFGFGFLAYNAAAAVVTLRTEPGSTERVTGTVGKHDSVTVHVTYLYYCAVPVVSALMCDSLADLTGWGQALDHAERLSLAFTRGDYDTVRDGLWNLENHLAPSEEQVALREELKHAASPGLLLPLLLTPARFMVIEGEATLPNQGADYETPTRDAT
jgi:hypothetical protein